ncbi:MAG: hypothetical protein AABY07_01030 [Nanoarchaeota archaeon]
MKKILDINYIGIQRCQRGWECRIDFWCKTRRQFTEELVTALGGGKNLFSAIFNGVFLSYKEKSKLQSIPGEFQLE